MRISGFGKGLLTADFLEFETAILEKELKAANGEEEEEEKPKKKGRMKILIMHFD